MGAVLSAVMASTCSYGGPAIPARVPGPSLGGTWLGWFSRVSTGTKKAMVTTFQIGSVLSGFRTTFDTAG